MISTGKALSIIIRCKQIRHTAKTHHTGGAYSSIGIPDQKTGFVQNIVLPVVQVQKMHGKSNDWINDQLIN